MGDNIVNFYAGQPPLNRLSFQRPSATKINEHLFSDNARFIAFSCVSRDFKPLMRKDEPGKMMCLTRSDVEASLGSGFSGPPAEDAHVKEKARLWESARLPPASPVIVFLGIDDRPSASSSSVLASSDPLNPKGIPYFAVAVGDEWEVEGAEWGDTRNVATAMNGWEAGIFAQARALVDWNVRNKFCPACGNLTYSLWAGYKRNCITAMEPIPGKEPCFSTKGLHNFAYPRTDPVIIMGILNAKGDKMLLGRQSKWPKGMYSCLAGFVEPGESFEDAVRREVLEEAGIEVRPVRYSSSQPWPYPANIMVGCYGRAKDDQVIRLDLDNELEDAQWFSRSDLVALVASPSGSALSEADIKQFGKAATSHFHTSDQETAAALAPSEGRAVDNEVGDKKGLTRVPPDTAIAGQLIRLWTKGGVDLVSRL